MVLTTPATPTCPTSCIVRCVVFLYVYYSPLASLRIDILHSVHMSHVLSHFALPTQHLPFSIVPLGLGIMSILCDLYLTV